MTLHSTLLRAAIGLLLLSAAFVAGRLSGGPRQSVSTHTVSPAASLNAPGLRTGASALGAAPDLFEGADKGSVDGVPARLAALRRSGAMSLAEEEERRRLLEDWAVRDPAAAMRFALSELRGDRRAQAESAILSIWGRKHPAEAWNWVLTDQPASTHHFDTLLEVFGRQDPALAARYAAEYSGQHPANAVEAHLAALLGVTYNGGFDAARALVDANKMLAPEERGVLLNFIAGQWARFQPEQAASWVLAMPPGPGRDLALGGLGESWSDVNPSGAAAFAASLPDGAARQLALQQAISKWALEDTIAANKWILQNRPHADFDQAIAAMSTNQEFIQHHLELALTWADTIQGDALRSKSVCEIVANWFAADRSAALDYLEKSSSVSPEQKAELRRQLTGGAN